MWAKASTWAPAHPRCARRNPRTSRSGSCSGAGLGRAWKQRPPSACCRLSAAPSRWCSRCRGCRFCQLSLEGTKGTGCNEHGEERDEQGSWQEEMVPGTAASPLGAACSTIWQPGEHLAIPQVLRRVPHTWGAPKTPAKLHEGMGEGEDEGCQHRQRQPYPH